jgi:hypothetical protein
MISGGDPHLPHRSRHAGHIEHHAFPDRPHIPADPKSSGQQVQSPTAAPFGRERLTLHQAGVHDYLLIVHLRKIGERWICAESAELGVERKGDRMWKRAEVSLDGTVIGVFEKPGSGKLAREIPLQGCVKRRPRLVRQQLGDFEVPIKSPGQKK